MSTSTSETEPEVNSENFAQMNGISSTSPEMPPNATSNQEPLPEEFITRRNTWEQPWPKALLVGSGILVLVAVLGSMLRGTTEAFNGAVATQKNTADQSLTADSKPASKAKENETDGDKDAKLALTTQLNDLRNHNLHPDSTTPAPSPLPIASTEPSSLNAPSPQRVRHLSQRVQPDDAPPQRVYSPTPLQGVPLQREAPAPVKRTEVASLDPALAWAQASSTGTWGGVPLSQRGNAIGGDSASAGIEQRISSAGQFVASKNVDSVAGGSERKPIQSCPAVNEDTSLRTNKPKTRLDNFESLVCNSTAQTFPLTVKSKQKEPDSNEASHSTIANVPAGTRVKGVITAPMAWAGSDGSSSPIQQVASIQLSENLTGSDGQVVLPDRSVVIAKVTRATSSGLVTMVAISAQTPFGDKSFPDNSVLVLAQGGRLLRAKVELPGLVGDNVGTALIAGINKGAATINSPTSSSSSGYSGSGGGFQSFNFNSKNNVLAGVAEGVTGALVQSGMARNQQQMQRVQSQEPTYVIKEHTLVEISFNQSIAL